MSGSEGGVGGRGYGGGMVWSEPSGGAPHALWTPRFGSLMVRAPSINIRATSSNFSTNLF